VEANAYGKLAEIVRRDYATYSGRLLERFFKEAMRETGNYTHIGSWWNRKGENEIDIIAADDIEKRVTFYEVKRQEDEIDMALPTSCSCRAGTAAYPPSLWNSSTTTPWTPPSTRYTMVFTIYLFTIYYLIETAQPQS